MIDSPTEPASAAGLAVLSDLDWLSALDGIGEDRGSFEPLGRLHSAIFTDRGTSLLVTFETLRSVRAGASQLPLGFALADPHDWSQLCLLSHEDRWFRDPRVFAHFDRLIDDGFFEDFDQIVFYGAGMCGYAAAAYSVAAPGATVVALAPQATLAHDIAGWDRRFPAARRLSFTDRYGYAPDMIEGAGDVIVFYDPLVEPDWIHAGHFTGPHVRRIALRHAGSDLQAELLRMGFLPGLIQHVMAGKLGTAQLMRAWRRARHGDAKWLQSFLRELGEADLTCRLAQAAQSVARRAPLRRAGRRAIPAPPPEPARIAPAEQP